MKFTLHQDEDLTVLRFEPSAMISAREGDPSGLLAQLFIPAAVVGTWCLGKSFGLVGGHLWAWVVGSGILLVGGAGVRLAMKAIEYSVKPHPRLVILGTKEYLIGFPTKAELTVPMSDICIFTIKRQRFALRPWLRYSVGVLDHKGRERRLTPSVLRRSEAADIAAAMTDWAHYPEAFTRAVKAQRGVEFLEKLWDGFSPGAAIDSLAA